MYIKKIELSNFQVIKEFDAVFEGNVYFITGENELGKSTLLKAISILLTGNRDEVLSNGAEKGFARAVIGDDGENYEVELRMTKANPRGTLTIKSQKTGMQSDRISMLQQIFGYQDFDAVEFSQWSETAEGRRKQVEVVKSLLPVDIQTRIVAIDNEVKTIKDGERKDANAELKTYTTIVVNAEKLITPGDIIKFSKLEPIKMDDLMEEQKTNAQLIEKAKTVRQTKEERTKQIAEIPARLGKVETDYKAEVATIDQSVVDAQTEHDRIVKEAKEKLEKAKAGAKEKKAVAETNKKTAIQTINDEKADFEKRLTNCNNWLTDYEKNNPEETDTATKLKQAEEHNEKCTKVSEYNEKVKLKKAVEKKIEALETKLTKLASERETLISKSKLPIDGLNFTEDGLELNGVPFAPGKVSDSQIMEVAAKLIICKNPTVKVFRVGRGESLGKHRLQTIVELAKREGYQGFIEQVVRDQNDMRVEEYIEQ